MKMGFPDKIKKLVKKKSDWRCCISRGDALYDILDIHHIKPKKYGGNDLIENAAPFRPDYHRIYQRIYDRTPSIRKLLIEFTKKARDNWYEIVKNYRINHEKNKFVFSGEEKNIREKIYSEYGEEKL